MTAYSGAWSGARRTRKRFTSWIWKAGTASGGVAVTNLRIDCNRMLSGYDQQSDGHLAIDSDATTLLLLAVRAGSSCSTRYSNNGLKNMSNDVIFVLAVTIAAGLFVALFWNQEW